MSQNSFTVLYVEDEPLLREIITDEFQSLDVNVFSANSGFDAIKILKNETIDVVVTDMRMPDVDGMGLRKLAALEQKNIYQPKVWILLSAFSNQSPDELMALGFDEVFYKPIKVAILLSACRNALAKKAAIAAAA
jgi:two-component system capsular synthesis sensor histidine kinase RcsC